MQKYQNDHQISMHSVFGIGSKRIKILKVISSEIDPFISVLSF